MSASQSAFAALLADGRVLTWGSGLSGGDSSGVQSHLSNVQKIHATASAFIATLGDGKAVTWGIPHGHHIQDLLLHVQKVRATMQGTSAAILGDGSVLTWGSPGYAASNEMRRQLHHVQEISVTDHAFAALNGDGRIVTWGVPEFGGNSSSVQEELHHVQKIVATAWQDVVAEHINVWVEENSTELHRDVALKAAEIYSNALGTEELKPTPDTQSWMEQECKVMGQMPFMYSCSNRINVLVQSCGFDNAFVMSSDYLVNYPAPVNNKSNNNNDIIFYLCQELVDGNPNPYAVANTFAHELAHVIQGGFGSSSGVMMEGGATWLEGNLLNLAPRPMIYAWGFRDWSGGSSKKTNARKFYQIHAMLLTYLKQEALLGDRGSSALQNYETFSEDLAPFGRRTYDYFLQFVGKDQPGAFDPLELEVNSVEHPFGEVLLNFRVALAAQCINEASKRPTEPRYWMPENLRDRPFWDCTSFPTFGPTEGAAQHEGLELHYGGAGIYRLALAADATVQVDPSADWQLRTKVLAAGHAGGPAEVRELRPGETATLGLLLGEEKETEHEGDGGFFSKTENGCEIDGWDGVQVRLHVYSDPTADAHSHGEQVVVLEPHGGYDNRSHHVIAALGNVGIRAPYTKSYAKDCKSLDGWTGSSPHDGFAALSAWSISGVAVHHGVRGVARVDLVVFRAWRFRMGEYARVEVVFASDSGTVMSGFWLKDLEVKSNGQVVFNQTESLYGSTFVYSIPAGTMGSAGVPVVVQYPDGFEADVGLKKASVNHGSTRN
eukprot:g15083.t1